MPGTSLARHSVRSIHLRLVPLIGCAVLGACWLAAVAPPATASSMWRPVDALRYFVDGEVDYASRIYRGVGRYLVRPSEGDQVYVLSTREETVVALPAAAVTLGDGEVTLDEATLAGATANGSFTKEDRGRWLRWQSGETAMAVGPKPELVGVATLEQVLGEKAEYGEKVEAYEPDPEMLETIEKSADGFDFVVGFGTWCPVCAEWTPRFIKTIESAGIDSTRLTFVSTDPELTKPAESLEHYGIDGVPVFIVMRDGTEVGRIDLGDIDRDPSVSIESHLARVLNGQGS
ncbi:MAG: thioredoxin family protein [Candidatus Eiseniibacteriota bacterium]|jgi:hypothetical protein